MLLANRGSSKANGAQHYGFTPEELDYIINYDIKYRMGSELDGKRSEGARPGAWHSPGVLEYLHAHSIHRSTSPGSALRAEASFGRLPVSSAIMTMETIEKDFRDKVSAEIRLEPEGKNRYRVFTPFMFDDGDNLAVVLKKDNGAWALSDEGHTLMHLTYEIDEKSLQQGTRQKVITNALSTYAVSDRDGELLTTIADGDYGNALFSYVQALLELTDLTFLSRERVRSTEPSTVSVVFAGLA